MDSRLKFAGGCYPHVLLLLLLLMRLLMVIMLLLLMLLLLLLAKANHGCSNFAVNRLYNCG